MFRTSVGELVCLVNFLVIETYGMSLGMKTWIHVDGANDGGMIMHDFFTPIFLFIYRESQDL